MPLIYLTEKWSSSAPLRAFCGVVAIGLLFALFAAGVARNPPGFYVDESALSYNAYLVSQTGAGESGVKFPLFFPVYAGVFTQYANPTQIYVLTAVFKLFGPSIPAARLTAASGVFLACLMLSFLTRRMTKSSLIAGIVFCLALATPWMFDVGRIVLETFLYPLIVVWLLWSVFRVSEKPAWSLPDTVLIAAALAFATYSYTIGRALGPLLAAGLVLFATNRTRLISVLKVWATYGLVLIPLIVSLRQNQDLTLRFKTLSYIQPESSIIDIAGTFLYRFAQDLNPLAMLLTGDVNPRHHLPGLQGSFYFGVFALSVMGIVIVFGHYRSSPFWRYVIFGLLASLVPGALTVDPFHTLRMIAYPVFLLLLTVPALACLFGKELFPEGLRVERGSRSFALFSSVTLRRGIAAALLTITCFEAGAYFWRYYHEGGERREYFDAGYKPLYNEAVAQPSRPIYLADGYWGPGYVHAFWYATLEGRSLEEFVHLPYREPAPAGALVLSSEYDCRNCEIVSTNDQYLLYFAVE